MTLDGAHGATSPGPLPELRGILALFSTPGSQVALTLQVRGLVVTGQAVPPSTWLRALAGRPIRPDGPTDDLTEAHGADEGLVQSLHGRAVMADLEAGVHGHQLRPDDITTVNLVDVVIDPLVGDECAERRAWQIPITSIDGWSLDDGADDARVTPGPTWLAMRRGEHETVDPRGPRLDDAVRAEDDPDA